ncbi:MAG: hypothetical protein FWD06_01965 [Oscillospiraceae bacterium]|nr:hypothetical protein [Oscillospiraceae bacterium]
MFKRRGFLYTTLALVLSAALLTSAIAAPQLVQHIATQQQEIAVRHTPATAAISSLSGPLNVSVVDQHSVVWAATTQVDVFGGDFFVPGSIGSYEFTLHNHESFEVAYLFHLNRGADTRGDWQDLPLLYRVDGSPWAPFSEVEQEGVLLGGQSRTFMLEWTWPFHIDGAQDTLDTGVGSNYLYTWYQLELEIILEYDPPEENDEPPSRGWWWWLLIPLFGIILFIFFVILAFVGGRIAGQLFCWYLENC